MTSDWSCHKIKAPARKRRPGGSTASVRLSVFPHYSPQHMRTSMPVSSKQATGTLHRHLNLFPDLFRTSTSTEEVTAPFEPHTVYCGSANHSHTSSSSSLPDLQLVGFSSDPQVVRALMTSCRSSSQSKTELWNAVSAGHFPLQTDAGRVASRGQI